MRTDYFPVRTPWRDRYPGARIEWRGEGGAVWCADGEGDPVVLVAEGVMADYLDPVADADLLDS